MAAKAKYDKPELRERIKATVMAGDKGGRPGQWSARKAQLVAHEYEAAGGGYLGPPAESQQHLHQWTDEHWQTQDGKPAVAGKTTHRYLPQKAWDELTPAEKKKTDAKKVSASKRGKQFVANTPAAKKARKAATADKPKTPPGKSAKTTAKKPAATKTRPRAKSTARAK